jgi:hypothetical protein
MWEMAKTSVVLFLHGRLFQDPTKVMTQVAVGILFTALMLFGLALAGVPIMAAAGIAGFFGGILQPYLFRNLKYR